MKKIIKTNKINLILTMLLVVYSTFPVVAQKIDGTMSEELKQELYLNLKVNGSPQIKKALEEVGYSNRHQNTREKLLKRANSPYGVNLREKHLKPETLKTYTIRHDVIDGSTWCGYIAPTSNSGHISTPPDLGRGLVIFSKDELTNLPKVKNAYLTIRWAIGNLSKLEVYKAKKEINDWSDITDTDDKLGSGKQIDVTEIVQEWIDNPDSNYGLILVDSRGDYQYNNYPSSWHNTLGDHITIPKDGIELDIIFDMDPLFPPAYIPGTDLGYFIWKDSNGWHLRSSGGGYGIPHVFEGYFISDDSFIEVNGINLENDKDTLTTDVHRVSFKFDVNGEEDGIDFKTSGGTAPIKFFINIDGTYQRTKIYVGQYKQHPELYPLILQ